MKVKLCDLKALENLTIAAYDIPDNMVLASKAKFTKAAGKNNCFISGAPSQAIDRDLEVLSVSAHRISCTYSFSMSEKGYEELIETLMKRPDFTNNPKYNKKYHRVFYVNKRKFTISYFNKKRIATVYASNDLFDTDLAPLFDRQWGDPIESGTAKKEAAKKETAKKEAVKKEAAKKETAKEAPKKEAAKKAAVKTESHKWEKKKQPAVAALTALLVAEEPLRLEKSEPHWTVQDISFRVNRIVVVGEKLSLSSTKKLKEITDKSNNSVSLKIENTGPGKRKQAVTLTSNINSYLVEAIDCVKAESPEPLSFELRFPMKTATWDYICKNSWLDGAANESLENGFKMVSEGQSVFFKRNNNTGVCEMKGLNTELLRDCIIRLEDIFENNTGDRRVEKESINEVIRKKIPYTIRILKDQADQFINLISPSFVLLNDASIELTDYSPMVFSVYRGIELYLKYLADLSGIDLANQPVGKIFKTVGRQKHQYLQMINDSMKGEMLQSIFENFGSYRNALFHANLDNVMVIGSREAAEDICISALQNLEAASFQFHLEEMTITI
ncbi:type II toxin-antitoxin system RnlA family toxin [Eubacterium sp. 1001713B170207_170306_E7]|uniref:type II toxin-antitoxin system RnlA family toxin n=1 Tax=Eubacterium sp. 1001713B170207_170306_E7 TaxID=2787097 RepID=UPI001899C233|nr:type II toxin-antitoxin system RnlA family toxin [Eubacterium sp. 1001713B170207_170306_E7]